MTDIIVDGAVKLLVIGRGNMFSTLLVEVATTIYIVGKIRETVRGFLNCLMIKKHRTKRAARFNYVGGCHPRKTNFRETA